MLQTSLDLIEKLEREIEHVTAVGLKKQNGLAITAWFRSWRGHPSFTYQHVFSQREISESNEDWLINMFIERANYEFRAVSNRFGNNDKPMSQPGANTQAS